MIRHYTTYSLFDCFTLKILQMKKQRYFIHIFNGDGKFQDSFYVDTFEKVLEIYSRYYKQGKAVSIDYVAKILYEGV